MIKITATIYSILLCSTAIWAWATYFQYRQSNTEHLLPAIILNIAALPASLLMESVVEYVPQLLNPAAMLTTVTGLGAIQALSLWLLAVRFKQGN